MAMATPDVTVHVEEVVVVTTPDNPIDGTSVEEVKTVLVDFKSTQPSGGLSDDSMDSVNTPGTFTPSSTLIQKGDIIEVKIGDDEDNMVAEMIYPITCGESKANLVWKKFVCPGINVKCVQFDYQLISPKEFVNLAGKSTLKDWKRAIRLNGVMLRKIMDSGELDFYQHSLVCSNTCRSTKIDLSSARSSLSSQQSTDYIPVTPVTADVNGSSVISAVENCEENSEWITTIGDDAFSLWRGLKDAGLMDEIVQELQQELQNTLKVLHQRLQQPPLQVSDVVILNNIVQNFGLLDLVKKVLTGHKSQMDRSREQYTRDLAALEQQCDEHRKRAKELKHKSQHLNNVLMNLTPIAATPPSKRPRLTRATSGPATVAAHIVPSSQPTQITLTSGGPISQLTTIPIGKLTTVSAIQASTLGKGSHMATFTTTGSPLIGGYNVLTSASSGLPNTVEIHPDASNLAVLSRAAIQDGNTLVKVVSPIQLYATVPGLSTALQNTAQMASLGSTIVAVSNALETSTSVEGHATIQVTSVCEEHELKP